MSDSNDFLYHPLRLRPGPCADCLPLREKLREVEAVLESAPLRFDGRGDFDADSCDECVSLRRNLTAAQQTVEACRAATAAMQTKLNAVIASESNRALKSQLKAAEIVVEAARSFLRARQTETNSWRVDGFASDLAVAVQRYDKNTSTKSTT